MAHAIDTRRSQMNQLVQRMLNLEHSTIQLDPRYRPKEVKNPLKVGDTVYTCLPSSKVNGLLGYFSDSIIVFG